MPLADQQRESAVGPQHRDDRVQRPGRIIDEAEHAVTQDQVDTLLGRQLAQVAQVALQTGDPVSHSLFVGSPGEGSQGVGAGVDDGDPVALGSHPDREPAGAAADVEDLLLPTALEHGADGVPDHRGAGGSTTFEGAVHARHPRGPSGQLSPVGADHPELPGLRCHSLRATSPVTVPVDPPAGLMSAYGDIR